ncbi:Mannan endo-1,4-beta-mannosidase 7 [Castilleja foliolosa]|uniref:mannan endo-1,4-beta-mannosidase n=1 Tax=Castilleja foliolosa TaxID=1961234 RepID=A0ABD3ECJ2_9LAMI
MFIRTKGRHFFLNGKPYFANGFNAYWLMYRASDPSGYGRLNVSAMFRQAASARLTIVRTWAFNDGYINNDRPLQYSPGFYNEQVFKGLDYVVAEARKFRIKLILSLVNNYDDYGGKKQYVNWAVSQGQHLTSDGAFFTNPSVKQFYKNHIKAVLNRYNTITRKLYKNDPTIMAWELMNEPRCSDPSGNTIQNWIIEMAAYVKSIDRNHLLEVGSEGFYGPSSHRRTKYNPSGSNEGTDFIKNNRIKHIDFATLHSYPDAWLPSYTEQNKLSFLRKWLNAHIYDAQHVLNKPILMTEFGKSLKVNNINQRDELFKTVYSKIYKSAKLGGPAAGGLFWHVLAKDMDSYRDGYEIILEEKSSTANIIAWQAYKMYKLKILFSRMRRRASARRDQLLASHP